MRKKFIPALILSLALLCSACGTPANTPSSSSAGSSSAEDINMTVDCRNGHFVGQLEDTGVLSFKGIPYAKAPVGELRWKAPQAPDDSDETFAADQFGKSSIQYEWPSERASYNEIGEDCLTLNVWTKDLSTTGKPVMVFFHGGGFAWGGTADPLYDGQFFVEENEDIVMVTANYRIGFMGFIDFSRVEGGEDYEDSTCLGLLDHIQALKWVQENIEAFGGDPNNVTIFGESAGGGTTSLLCVVEEAQGLFQKCISESGGLALTYSQEEYDEMGLTEALMEVSGAKNMADLIAIPEEQLIEYYLMPLDDEGTCMNDLYGMPLRGRSVVPEDPYQAAADGVGKDIIYMAGSNANELNYWIAEIAMEFAEDPTDLQQEELEAAIPLLEEFLEPRLETVRTLGTAEQSALLDQYLAEQADKDTLGAKTEFANDVIFRVPALTQAARHSDAGGKSYISYFAKESTDPEMGACHASELAYIFHNEADSGFSGTVDTALADKLCTAWANFARTGDPSIEGAEWTPYDSETRATMVIGNDSSMRMENDWLGAQRTLIEPLLDLYVK